MNLSITEANKILRYVDWSSLLHVDDGTMVGVLINGEPSVATVVETVDKEDEDNDRDLSVTVRVFDQYFQKTGWAQIGSHCYGEYEPSWHDLKEVRAVQKVVTVYEVV